MTGLCKSDPRPRFQPVRFVRPALAPPRSPPLDRRMASATELTIRPATVRDAPEIARLLTVLGHPSTPDEVAARWPSFVAEGNLAFVADRNDGTLGGVATVHRTTVL